MICTFCKTPHRTKKILRVIFSFFFSPVPKSIVQYTLLKKKNNIANCRQTFLASRSRISSSFVLFFIIYFLFNLLFRCEECQTVKWFASSIDILWHKKRTRFNENWKKKQVEGEEFLHFFYNKVYTKGTTGQD